MEKFYPPAKRIEMFSITDTGDALLMATCPACHAAYFFESEISLCTMLGAKNIHGEPLNPEPMETVCDGCIKSAEKFVDGAYLAILYQNGHLAAADMLIGALAGRDMVVPDHFLSSPTDVLDFIGDIADSQNRDWYEGEWDEIWNLLKSAHKNAA